MYVPRPALTHIVSVSSVQDRDWPCNKTWQLLMYRGQEKNTRYLGSVLTSDHLPRYLDRRHKFDIVCTNLQGTPLEMTFTAR